MFYVYVLVNKKNHETYIGSTNDLKRRLKEHNKGLVLSTKKYMPWELKYYESFDNENLARIREQKLKHNGNARKELLKRVGLPSTTLQYAKNGAGFTLIELILAITLLAIIVGIGAPFLLSYQRSTILRSDMYSAQESIRRAQALSRSSAEDSNWGAYLTDDDVTVYSGDSYVTRDASLDEVITFSDITTISGTIEYNFDIITGETQDVGTTTLTVDAKTKDITVNEAGLVTQ